MPRNILWFFLVTAIAIMVAFIAFIFFFHLLGFSGRDFNQNRWQERTSIPTCERATMLRDLRQNHLAKGMMRKDVEALLGAPTCRYPNSDVYSLGACVPLGKSRWGVLKVVYNQGKHTHNHLYFDKATTPLPSHDMPTFAQYRQNPRMWKEKALNLPHWENINGVRYSVNRNNELIVATPGGDFSFIANFYNGLMGVCLISLEQEKRPAQPPRTLQNKNLTVIKAPW